MGGPLWELQLCFHLCSKYENTYLIRIFGPAMLSGRKHTLKSVARPPLPRPTHTSEQMKSDDICLSLLQQIFTPWLHIFTVQLIHQLMDVPNDLSLGEAPLAGLVGELEDEVRTLQSRTLLLAPRLKTLGQLYIQYVL